MVAAVEGKFRLSKTTPAGPAPAEWCMRGPDALGPTPSRETFVLGIFAEFDAANTAIRRLTSALYQSTEAVLLSRYDKTPRMEGRPRPPWLEQNLTQCLADGASVVVVRTDAPEQQLAISRALLDLGCDVLLTHDVTAPNSGTAGNRAHNPVIFR